MHVLGLLYNPAGHQITKPVCFCASEWEAEQERWAHWNRRNKTRGVVDKRKWCVQPSLERYTKEGTANLWQREFQNAQRGHSHLTRVCSETLCPFSRATTWPSRFFFFFLWLFILNLDTKSPSSKRISVKLWKKIKNFWLSLMGSTLKKTQY